MGRIRFGAVGLAVLAGLLAGAPARAQDFDSAALEAEIERARAEEAAAADAWSGAAGGAPPPDPGTDASTTATLWDPGLAEDRLRDYQIDAAWRAAFQEVASEAAFREAGCFSSPEQLAAGVGERIRHRRLTREDFRARRKSRDAKLAVQIRNAVTEAHVSTSIVCVGRLRAEEVTRGRFAVWFDELEYVALLDPEGSWWNPKAETHPEWVMRHEQLHFDITELVARRHNAERARHAAATKVVADSPREAMRGFAARWSEHFRAVIDEWRALQDQYDRETRHGTVPKQQTEWFARVQREMATSSRAAR